MTRVGRLEFGITACAIFLAGFTNWRYRGINFTYGDIAFCFSLFLLVVRGELPRMPFGWLTSLWHLFFAGFLVALTASSLFSPEPVRALVVSSQYIFAYLILTLILMGRDLETTIRFLKVYVLSMTAICLIGLWYFHFTDIKEAWGHVLISGSNRLSSVLGNANAFAAMVGLTFPVVLHLWLSQHLRMWLAVPALVTLGLALIASSSVSGLATGVLGVLMFLVLSGRLATGRMIGGGLLLGAVVGVILFSGVVELPETFERRVLEPLRTGHLDELGTYSARLALIEEALEALDDTMLLGMGADQFRTSTDIQAPVHNLYLLLWVEGGLPALLSWLGLLGLAAVMAFRALFVPATRPVGALALTVVFLFSCMSFNAAHVYARFRVIPLFLTLGLVLAVRDEAERRRADAAAGAPPQAGPEAWAGWQPLERP